MSYRGRPSKGCEGCRARKVKCDEARPKCTRCNRSGSECKYRDPSDLLFKNQTESAAQRAEENWRKRSKSRSRARSESITQLNAEASERPSSVRQRALSSASRPLNRSSLSISSSERNSPLPTIHDTWDPNVSSLLTAPSLTPDLHQIAYDRFIYDFVSAGSPNLPPDEPSDALFTFIPILYQNASSESCLAKVVDAVAYMNLANRGNMPQAALLAEASMGEGIKKLSRMIADREQAASNDALCSTHLMTVYENLTSTHSRETFKAHQHGAKALLQLRTVEQYYSNPVSAQLYELIFWQQTIGSLHAGKAPPIPIEQFITGRQNLLGPYNESNTLLTKIIWKETALHAQWLQVKHSTDPPDNRLDLQQLLQTAIDLDTDFQNWEYNMPIAWRHGVQPNVPIQRYSCDELWRTLVLEGSGAPKEIFSFTNLKRCWLLGFYRTSRLFLLRDTLEILNWMLRFPDPVSPTQINTPGYPLTTDYSTPQPHPTSILSTASLQHRHATATNHLVSTLEHTCSAVLGSFTVPIPSKSSTPTGVVTMRGYVVLWAMGTMDSILSSGLVPDSSTAPLSPPTTTCSSPQTHMPIYASHASLASALDHPSLGYADAAAPDDGFSAAEPFSLAHAGDPRYLGPGAASEASGMHHRAPVWDAKAKKNHVFDAYPRHVFDCPVDVALGVEGGARAGIDVAARRVWLNRMLYYIGTELGIKKALAVPLSEGYWDVVKAEVDGILGR